MACGHYCDFNDHTTQYLVERMGQAIYNFWYISHMLGISKLMNPPTSYKAIKTIQDLEYNE